MMTRRMQCRRAWNWRKITWPLIVHILDCSDENMDIECALICVVSLPTFRAQVSHLLMNLGTLKIDDIDSICNEIVWFHDQYDILHLSVKRKLEKAYYERFVVEFNDDDFDLHFP